MRLKYEASFNPMDMDKTICASLTGFTRQQAELPVRMTVRRSLFYWPYFWLASGTSEQLVLVMVGGNSAKKIIGEAESYFLGIMHASEQTSLRVNPQVCRKLHA